MSSGMTFGRDRDGDAREHEGNKEDLEREREAVRFVAGEQPSYQGPAGQTADVCDRADDPSPPSLQASWP